MRAPKVVSFIVSNNTMRNLKNSFKQTLILFAFVLCSVIATNAQTTSTITGTVTDQKNAVLAGATLMARHLETGITKTVTSDGEGRFTFIGMPVGKYEIRAEMQGFKPLVRKGINVTVAEEAKVDFQLEIQSPEATVTITDDIALVNTQTSEVSYLVNERAIRDLPLNGRNVTDLAFLQPSVIAYPHRDTGSVVAHGVGASINGQDPRSNVYLLDGTPQNDFTNGPAGSAAGTSLGVDTIREFRVEVNSYSAEFGRNFGGQINAITKSGTNNLNGTLYWFHRNDNFDARNFFDGAKTPEFKRNQFGGNIGGPIKQDKLFYFFGYEALRENLGRTIQTIVPDLNARQGIIPGGNVTVNPVVRPYLDQFPLPNGATLGNGLARYSFGFNQTIDQHFLQGRVDYNYDSNNQFFARYTFDDADQNLPTDFPQFPRVFISRNQFFTGEYRQTISPNTFNTFRFSFGRTRIGQDVEANLSSPLQPFVPNQTLVGNIDIAGIPRFGPQSSVNVQLTQNVFGFDYGIVHTRGRHLIKAGALVERYQDNLFNPTFSLGIYTFSSLRNFLLGTAQRFVGLRPSGALDRYWRFTLFGFYLHDTYRVNSRLSVNAGVRYETTTMPIDIYGRDSALINLTDRVETVGPLYENPTRKNIAPRVGFAWDVFGNGKTSLRGGYGIYFNTNNQQNLIVTITNPPFTPRVVFANPTFPNPPFQNTSINSIRPVQFDLNNPYLQVWNLNAQHELPFETLISIGYTGSRGIHLLRSNDVNTAIPQIRADGTPFYPAGSPRRNTAFSTIELKSSDGNSWYNAAIFEIRKRLSKGLSVQSSYTFSRNIDTTQASTFFSDGTNGTTSAFPEYAAFNYNKGLADYHAKHNWVVNFIYDIPKFESLTGIANVLLNDWQIAGIAQMRSGNPLTVFVQNNRSRSLWAPSVAPGIGVDRPSIASGFTFQSAVTGNPDGYFNPAAFVLQPAGTLGSLGRGTFIGPNLRTFDLSAIKTFRLPQIGDSARLQFRMEAFNLFNRANFAPPSLIAFNGTTDGELPLSSFGRILRTITSSRQIQFGLRFTY
jgi:hypothetical protein